MEFDEMKKIWDAQNNQPLYVIDEKALHKRIQAKMNGVRHMASLSELFSIVVNLGSGGLLLVLSRLKLWGNVFLNPAVFLYPAVWNFVTAVYMVVSRIRRIKASRRFDRSIHGDLNHAISLAGYQVRLTRIMYWNVLPSGASFLFMGWKGWTLIYTSAVILGSFVLAYYLGIKADRYNKLRKRELQVLKEKLESDD